MIIHLDTSLLVDALSGTRRALPALRVAASAGNRLTLSTIVLYEWLRGPRSDDEHRAHARLFPLDDVVPFGVDAARIAADVYQSLKRPRARQIDIAIAACAIEHNAALWTLNTQDFDDIPGLMLYRG
ncbi:MAG TPA: type II toxin-antitoxin system VapC family toxin [Vicinamibacterales bacterium]|nr:type II toxin-antitoxin system VapC family toxin [Vicinamibacterales bacterium]